MIWLSSVFSFVYMVNHSSFMCPWHMAWPCLIEDELPEVIKLQSIAQVERQRLVTG
jgi:hypothetical protein